jgi:hypothetical protein
MGAQQSIDETFPSHTVQEIPYKLFQYISFYFAYVSTILQLDFETIFDNAVFLFLNFITQELCL